MRDGAPEPQKKRGEVRGMAGDGGGPAGRRRTGGDGDSRRAVAAGTESIFSLSDGLSFYGGNARAHCPKQRERSRARKIASP